MSSHRYEDIRKIVIAKTVVERGSLQKAAQELKVTPSAVSQSLGALERRLGSPLFLRQQGKLVPTSRCLALIEKALPAFRALDSLFESEEKPKFSIDSLDLGTYESLAHSVLADFMRELRRDFPKVKCNFVVNRTAEILKRLRTGELCTALVIECDLMERVRKEEVGRDELGLYISSDYADRRDDWKFIETLGFGFISTGLDGLPQYMKHFLKPFGAKIRTTMTSDSLEVLRRAAALGLVASALPKRVAKRSGEELVEVTRIGGQQKSETGEHKIYLASMDRCDEHEAQYLSSLARECFRREAESLGLESLLT